MTHSSQAGLASIRGGNRHQANAQALVAVAAYYYAGSDVEPPKPYEWATFARMRNAGLEALKASS